MQLDVRHPVVLGPGEGETIRDTPRSSVVIKADLEELALTESRYAAGERGPNPHIHRTHADAFYVLEGVLSFAVGPDDVEAGAGSLMLAPAGVVHTFWNAGPAEARYLNIHAPGAGFADYLRALRDRRTEDARQFDTEDAPRDSGRSPSDAVVRRGGAGEVVALGPARGVFKAAVGDGDGTFSLTETELPSGYPGPVAHVHRTLVDSFYVLEGTLSVRVGDDVAELPAGSYAVVPPGNVHTFSNGSAEPVRMLNLMVPGGFEQYLKEAAAAGAGAPPTPERMAEIASKYDFEPAE